MDLLNETYEGSTTPYADDHGFCCYTIYDKEYEMYYSGMKAYQGDSHPVGITYFTSSTVVDFKTRFKNNTTNFEVKVEYFDTLAKAVEAEKKFHTKFNVGKNPKFYNVQISGGSHCGAGTVLCAKGDGTYYRVSMQEYAKGGHRHTVKGTFLVRTGHNQTLRRVSKAEYIPSIMRKQFEDHILCYDNVSNRNRKIPREEFLSNPDRFVGITKGKCVVYDKVTHEKIIIDAGTMNPATHYSKAKAKTIKVISMDGSIKTINSEDYDKTSTQFKHVNSSFVVRVNLLTMQIERVSRVDYHQNPNIYADLRAKSYFETKDGIFGSWRKLTKYYGVSQYMSLAKLERVMALTIHTRKIRDED